VPRFRKDWKILVEVAASEYSSTNDLLGSCMPAAVVCNRHPDSWAAYGRFIFHSVSTRCSRQVETIDEGLRLFRRPVWRHDPAVVCAFRDCASRGDSIWTTAEQTLTQLAERSHVDHLNVYVAGTVPDEDQGDFALHPVLDGKYVGMAIPYQTRDILEFPSTFEEFLKSLGPNNRRHMKARRSKAQKAGIQFVLRRHPVTTFAERSELGQRSRPKPYGPKKLDLWDAYAQAQPGFFQCALRGPQGAALSCCTGFVEGDTALMMYQLNDNSYPELGLTMTLRGFLIEHCISAGLRRIVLPMGISGHLEHAATTNPIAQVLFVKSSLTSVAKAVLMRRFAPESNQAIMAAKPGFVAQAFSFHRLAVHSLQTKVS
jgi:hypothetical protein